MPDPTTTPTPLWLDVPDEELSALAFLYETGLETRITTGQVLDLFLALRQARESLRLAKDEVAA